MPKRKLRNQHGEFETDKSPGQPPKWKKEYNKAIVDWFKSKADEPFREHFDEKDRAQLIPARCPTFEGFASSIDVVCDTLVEWAKAENEKKYPGFSASYARARQLQKDFLLANGTAGAGNPSFAIFMLKNNHGMRDTQDLTNDGGKFEKPVIVNPGGDMTI